MMSKTDPNVVDKSLQMFVIIKHGTEAGTLTTGFFFKLVVDDWSIK